MQAPLSTVDPAGRNARDDAIRSITPLINNVADELGEDQVRATLETLRALRRHSED